MTLYLTPRQTEIHDLLTSPMRVVDVVKHTKLSRSRVDQLIQDLIKYKAIKRVFQGKYVSLLKK